MTHLREKWPFLLYHIASLEGFGLQWLQHKCKNLPVCHTSHHFLIISQYMLYRSIVCGKVLDISIGLWIILALAILIYELYRASSCPCANDSGYHQAGQPWSTLSRRKHSVLHFRKSITFWDNWQSRIQDVLCICCKDVWSAFTFLTVFWTPGCSGLSWGFSNHQISLVIILSLLGGDLFCFDIT